MASNYSLATELHQGEVRRSERIPIRAVTGPRPVQASTREEQHSTYRKVLTRNAICDTCEKRNTTCMQKCTKCGLTSCLQCHNDGRYDSRHVLHLWSLDWTYPRGCRRANRSSRGNADNKTQPATRGSRNHTSVRERCLVREPVRPNNVGHDVAKPRERGTQSSYEQNISWNRESLVSNEWLPNQPRTSSVERAQTEVGDYQSPMVDIYDASPRLSAKTLPATSRMSGDGGYAPDPVHQYGNVVMTISSRAGENDKQPPNTSALDSGGEPSNSSSARALRWNAEAFPVADETMVSNCLVEGGRQLIYLASQSLDCVQIVARIADDIACAKRFLSRVDQWASNHPDDLERQWSFVNGLINQWHHNAYIAQVKGADGELSAIELLECSLSLWAMREDLPQGSFWVFWIEGMRQALKELN